MANSQPEDSFKYVYSCDVTEKIRIKIGTLEGIILKPTHEELVKDPKLYHAGVYRKDMSDPYVTCQLYYRGIGKQPVQQTRYKHHENRICWNEWISFPMKYCHALHDTLLAFTIYDTYDSNGPMIIGGTTISLFDEQGLCRQGMYDLKVWQRISADGSLDSKTPGIVDDGSEMSRLSKLVKLHRSGHLPKVDWMDRLAFREIEVINEKDKKESNALYLMVQFPEVFYKEDKYHIVYYEQDADIIQPPVPTYQCYDPGCDEPNLTEEMYKILSRGPNKSRDKPDPRDRDRLNELISRPPNAPINSSEKDFIWNYRKYLCTQSKALPKFLRSVQWDKENEVKQATKLLLEWCPMDSQGSLELLSSFFTNPAVRKYAVVRLNESSDEDLLLYLLQLVQALKNEKFSQTTEPAEPVMPDISPLTVSQASNTNESARSSLVKESSSTASIQTTNMISSKKVLPEIDLASFLIKRASENSKLANYLYWYLVVECTEELNGPQKKAEVLQMYKSVFARFMKALVKEGKAELKSTFFAQEQLLERIVNIMGAVAKETGNRLAKIKKLQSLLKENEPNSLCLLNFDPILLPLDPDVVVKGIDPDSATLFKSALMPCRLTFKTVDDTEYVTIFKHGDDLRQDQLVLQIIHLIDRLLKRENLDLKLTPYKVLATSSRHGFVQYIESTCMSEILSNDGSILGYLKRVAPSENSPLGVQPEVLDNYIKSCAGYVIITYILHVGDRHNDNILITKTGKLFHIDFGYILGRDPKVMAPVVKLTKEMVDAMGGVGSSHFAEFKQHCYTAFLRLRRSANLILNLFSLMQDADIPDIIIERERTVKKVVDKFHLDMNDEEAVHHLQRILDGCLSAPMGVFYEQMHKVSQFLKK